MRITPRTLDALPEQQAPQESDEPRQWHSVIASPTGDGTLTLTMTSSAGPVRLTPIPGFIDPRVSDVSSSAPVLIDSDDARSAIGWLQRTGRARMFVSAKNPNHVMLELDMSRIRAPRRTRRKLW